MKPERQKIASHIAMQLVAIRDMARQTMREVSAGAGIGLPYINNIERGRVVPTVDTLWKLSRHFDVAFGYWMEGFEDE